MKSKVRKRINISNFVNNFNKANDYALHKYAVIRDLSDNKIYLSIPIPINGNENNTEQYDLIEIDELDNIVESIKAMN